MIASLITALYLLGLVPAAKAATFLYIYGAMLLIAEIVIFSLGTLAATGLLALYVGYAIQTGDNVVFGVPLDWPLLFGMAFVEAALIGIIAVLFIRHRRLKATTGTEAMIGQKATVIDWNGRNGNVRIQGELWKAESEAPVELNKDEEVTVRAVDGLTLKISA